MYRQVLIKPQNRPFQRIIWRSEPSEPISIYELNTVTYGTASASFLAIRCLHQLAEENSRNFPAASEVIMSDFYVDDVLTGADSPEEAISLCQDLNSILNQGCFPLRKWTSSKPEILEKLTEDNSAENLIIGINENTKTLGLLWNPKQDTLFFKINPNISCTSTKRAILSVISQIFDPLGMFGACIITAKILLQALWQEKLDWDDSIPRALQREWDDFRENLFYLNELQIPRRVNFIRFLPNKEF
ncbi:Pao retrotransposon peptidase [Popillia japonica]|uniref:Pao retrotransposon peptidase n=1 Tax=Popillia japonica TaxID=7064 RepID=A0AAW1JD77_POPJA